MRQLLNIMIMKSQLLKIIAVSLLLLFFFTSGTTFSNLQAQDRNQEMRLAQQYFKQGEYEKAKVMYQKLYESSPNSRSYYSYYFKCLLALKEFDVAEKLVKKQIKKNKDEVLFLVDLGSLYKDKEETEKANEQFDKALKGVSEVRVRSLAYAFNQINELDYVIAAYEKGQKLSKDPTAYSKEIAEAYQRKGDIDKMIVNYLDHLLVNPHSVLIVKQQLRKVISNEDNMEELQRQLYGRIQEQPQEILYPELLIWTFQNQGDLESALTQAKALDKRLREEGIRIMELARQAKLDKKYDTAIEAYEYVVEKGSGNSLFMPAKVELLKCRNEKITTTHNYTPEDIQKLEQDYSDFLETFGKKPGTIQSMRDLSHLYAFYIYDLDKAIALLEEVVEMPSANKQLKAYSKLDLGDYYLMKDEIWEATLYYSQVDKDFKDDVLGEEARFKNAQLSYYNGDFEWAQAQLNVLKASTSELIANDALELSVFITDNLGLDTTSVPMETFAHSDLLIVQNKVPDALALLDQLNAKYPKHALSDDILYSRARIKVKKKEYDEAIKYLEQILSEYKEDILADNALFMLGDIYQKYKKDDNKAMEYYQSILVDHPGSLYGVEARKRFRMLRGDEVN